MRLLRRRLVLRSLNNRLGQDVILKERETSVAGILFEMRPDGVYVRDIGSGTFNYLGRKENGIWNSDPIRKEPILAKEGNKIAYGSAYREGIEIEILVYRLERR